MNFAIEQTLVLELLKKDDFFIFETLKTWFENHTFFSTNFQNVCLFWQIFSKSAFDLDP